MRSSSGTATYRFILPAKGWPPVPGFRSTAARASRTRGFATAAALSSNANASAVVSPEWVREHLPSGNTKVIDASWSLNKKAGTAHTVKLPGAIYFDIDAIADKSTWLPHMLPTTSTFATKMSELGITNDDQLLIYDESDGQFVASARVWWTFRVFGHTNVKVLAGGLKNWPKDLQIPQYANKQGPKYTVRKDPALVWSKYDMLDNLHSSAVQVIDARSKERFYGLVDEPRSDIPRGSIPYSVNVPFSSLLQPAQNEQGETLQVLKNETELRDIFQHAGVELERDTVVSCGSGVTACVVALALHELGQAKAAVYDGSWTEWAIADDTPKVIKRKANDTI